MSFRYTSVYVKASSQIVTSLFIYSAISDIQQSETDRILKVMLSTNEMEGNMGVRDAIYGPLLKVLKICALRLHIPPPTFNEANERKKLKSWAKVIFFWFIGVLILYRCIVLAINQYILMEDVNLMGVNAIQLTASLLSLTGFLLIYFWQRGEFLKSFPTEIELATRLKALKSTEKGGSYLRPWHTFWLISLVTTLAITAATEVVLVGEKPILSHDRLREGTLQYISILLFIPNLFIQFWSVVCAVCSIALLSLLHKAILSELSYFNDEIVEAAANGQLLHVDLLINYASRHLDILIICDIFNRRINIFISAWILLSLSAIIFNAITFFTSISNWSTAILCILLITIWAINMGIVVGNCFSLYTQIHRTRYLLLYEKNIWENANEKVCLLVSGMVKRIEIFDHLKLAGIIPVEPRNFLKVLFVVFIYFIVKNLLQVRLFTQSTKENVLGSLLNRTDDGSHSAITFV